MKLFSAFIPSRLDVAVGPLGGDIVVDTMICIIVAVVVLAAAAAVGIVLISRKKKSQEKNVASDSQSVDEKTKTENAGEERK